MHASICRPNPHLHIFPFSTSNLHPLFLKRIKTLSFFPTLISTPVSHSKPLLLSKSSPDFSNSDSLFIDDGNSSSEDSETASIPSSDSESESVSGKGVDIKVEKIGKNRRRICSRIGIDASLKTIWSLLTDYERLSDFIPGLAVCQLLEKKDNSVRLFQIGQQNLAFGLKFNAQGIVDCYEKDLMHLPFGQRRDIEFEMIEGDFQTFEGKWSIVQTDNEKCEDNGLSDGQEFQSILSYEVDVEPKMWLPVRLVEGRLCKEIEVNLICIREEAHRTVLEALGTC